MAKKINLVIAVVLLMLSCGKSQLNNGVTTIRFSWWGGDERHSPTLEVIKLYEELNPHIKIKAEYSGWSGHQEKIATQLAGRTAPDVMQLNHNWLDAFSKEGKGFYDLATLPDLNLEGYSSNLLELVTTNGHINMVPYAITGKAFGYNQQGMLDNGYSIPSSWDEMFLIGRDFGAKNSNNYLIVGDYEFTYQLMLYYLLQKTGKHYLNTEKRINYSLDDLTDGFNFIQKLNDEHVLIPIDKVLSMGNVGGVEQFTGWINGSLLTTYDWDSAIGKYETTLLNRGSVVVGPYPTLNNAVQQNAALYKLSLGLAINKHTKVPIESAKFLDFLINDPRAIKILSTSRGVPANPLAISVLRDAAMLSGLVIDANNLVMAYQGEALPTLVEHAKFKAMINQVFTEFAYKKINATTAANLFLSEGNTILGDLTK